LNTKSLLSREYLRQNGLEGTDFDPSVPGAFINLLPEAAIKTLEKINIELFTKDENELEQYCTPSPSTNRVRHAFWSAYHRAKEMHASHINWNLIATAAGVSHTQLQRMLTDTKRLVWVLCPIAQYNDVLREGLERGIRKMREALEADIFDSAGNLNVQTAKEVREIVQYLDKRMHGDIVQRFKIDSKSEVKSVRESSNHDEQQAKLSIDEEIKMIEEKLSGPSVEVKEDD